MIEKLNCSPVKQIAVVTDDIQTNISERENGALSSSVLRFFANGSLDTFQTRINFRNPSWYDEFLEIQSHLSNVKRINETEINAWWSGLKGMSDARLMQDYAIISNGCFSNPYGSIFLHESAVGTIKKSAKEVTKGKDFYCIYRRYE